MACLSSINLLYRVFDASGAVWREGLRGVPDEDDVPNLHALGGGIVDTIECTVEPLNTVPFPRLVCLFRGACFLMRKGSRSDDSEMRALPQAKQSAMWRCHVERGMGNTV